MLLHVAAFASSLRIASRAGFLRRADSVCDPEHRCQAGNSGEFSLFVGQVARGALGVLPDTPCKKTIAKVVITPIHFVLLLSMVLS